MSILEDVLRWANVDGHKHVHANLRVLQKSRKDAK